MDVISILRKKRQEVTHFEVVVNGAPAPGLSQVYTDIEIVYKVRGRNIDQASLERDSVVRRALLPWPWPCCARPPTSPTVTRSSRRAYARSGATGLVKCVSSCGGHFPAQRAGIFGCLLPILSAGTWAGRQVDSTSQLSATWLAVLPCAAPIVVNRSIVGMAAANRSGVNAEAAPCP